MPEIAEVETVRNTLKNMILGKVIKSVKVIYPKILDSNLEEFKSILPGKKFIDIKRNGKWLIFDLGDYYLLSHLRMEGKYFVKNHNEPINKHEHIIITFIDDTDLRYHDTRKFGRMKLIKKEELDSTPEIKKQGIKVLNQLVINLQKNIYIQKFIKVIYQLKLYYLTKQLSLVLVIFMLMKFYLHLILIL